MSAIWLVDGRRGSVDPADRGLAYGDGLFETMAAEAGRIRWLDQHFERLEDGCARLGMPAPDRAVVRAEIAEHCPPGRAVVKLIVTRGRGERGYRPPDHPSPTRILSISPWPDHPASHYTAGIRLRTCGMRLGENPLLAGMKHLCRLEQVLARRELEGHAAEEGLLLDASGFVAGGINCNLFAVASGELCTPALTRCGVKGVMRRIVLETAVADGLRVAEVDLAPAMLTGADEIFVTNALIGIWPVRAVDERGFAVGPVTRRLMERLGYAASV